MFSKLSPKILTLFVILAIIISTILIFQKSTTTQITKTELQKISLGIQTSPAMAIPMIAKDKGFFDKNGLDVEIKEFAAGKDALTAFLANSVDFAISGEVPAGLAMANLDQKFIIPAQVVNKTINEVRVVAIKDGNLNTPSEYFKSKKRKLATSIGGGPEYYTSEFLAKNNINKDEIEIIAQKPADMVAALVSGSVDAISIFDPVAFVAEQKLGERAITFKDSELYSELYVLEAKRSEIQNPEKTTKILKSFIEAENFIANNPQESKQIVAKYTKLDPAVIDGIWNSFDFRTSLTPQLKTYLEKQFYWATSNNKFKENTTKPNYDNFIYPDILKNLDPNKVKNNSSEAK
jgi:ABC-type nitrate/sulfonate/bicarbonate transport system substrate-binding protein